MRSHVLAIAATATMGTAALLIHSCIQCMVVWKTSAALHRSPSQKHFVHKHTCTCVPHCLFVFYWSYPKVVFPASTAHFYKWDCLKVNGSCTECWTNKPGNCVLCPRAKLWEQGNTELCWEEYKKTDINLANLNAPGAIPQTFTFAGTYKHSSKQWTYTYLYLYHLYTFVLAQVHHLSNVSIEFLFLSGGLTLLSCSTSTNCSVHFFGIISLNRCSAKFSI